MVTTPALARPLWRRGRFWVALAVAAVVVTIALGSLFDAPGRPLDPSSTEPDGSRAIARVAAEYGARVIGTDSLDTAQKTDGTVLVTSPDDYAVAQLRSLQAVGRVVLLRPSQRVVSALLPDVEASAEAPGSSPDCALPAATAAGDVDWPDDAVTYSGGQSCYDGGVVVAGGFVLVGSAALLTNDSVDGAGAAALAVNLLTSDRTVREVAWLSPGADAGGEGAASIWDLFPDGAYRVFWWLAGVGVLLVLWRARRLGGVVTEPLPVVVRAAELVEGHGRLYARARARDRAAAELRRTAQRRLADRLGLPRRASVTQLAAAARLRRPEVAVVELLDGPAPDDDAGLLELARSLDSLVESLGGQA